MSNETLILALGGAAVVLLLVLVTAAVTRRRAERAAREAAIRDQFGAELDRRADDVGFGQAADELEHTAARLEDLDTDRIGPDERAELTARWEAIQHDFLDSPTDAVRRADVLVTEVMRRRNLPTGSIDERMTTISTFDGDVGVEMRRAHDTFVALESDDADDLTTDDLRRSLLTYQRAFEAVLERPKSERDQRVDRAPSDR